jgi:chromosome segregation ATPase
LTTETAAKDAAISALTTETAAKDAAISALTTETAAKDAAISALTTETAAKDAAISALTTETAAKDAAISALTTETAAKDAAISALTTETAAKDAANTKLKEAEEKYKLLEDHILTIDEDYFNNAYENAKKKYMEGKELEGNKILDNITAIWGMLKDDIKLKTNKKIDDIIKNDIPKLKKNYNVAPDWLNKGGKRKINSSRTKRK